MKNISLSLSLSLSLPPDFLLTLTDDSFVTSDNPLWTESNLKFYEEQELSMNLNPLDDAVIPCSSSSGNNCATNGVTSSSALASSSSPVASSTSSSNNVHRVNGSLHHQNDHPHLLSHVPISSSCSPSIAKNVSSFNAHLPSQQTESRLLGEATPLRQPAAYSSAHLNNIMPSGHKNRLRQRVPADQVSITLHLSLSLSPSK